MLLESLLASAAEAECAGELEAALLTYERALPAAARVSPGRAADVLRAVGHLHFQRGDLEAAEDVFEAGLAVARMADTFAAPAALTNCLAVVAQFRGRPDEAERLYKEAGRLAAAGGDGLLVGKVEQNLGMLANVRGDVPLAIDRYRRALARFRGDGEERLTAGALNNLGMAYVDVAEWELAGSCFDEALQHADRTGDAAVLGSIETNRAELFLKLKRWDAAREACDRAFEIFMRAESRRWVAEVHKFYGVLYRETAKPALAAHHLERAASLAAESDDRLLEAEAYREWAVVHLNSGRNAAALRLLNRAASLFAAIQAAGDARDMDARLDGLEAMFLAVVRDWAQTIESKDAYTAGHCERVADHTCRLAHAIGFAGRDLTWIRMGGFLHDVGKTVVPADVLNKPGKLDPHEWELMKSHTTAGDAIVAELDFPWDIRPMVRSHHERWDGTGYPDGLAGEAIPLHARILCVADVFDALTTARSYRPALSVAEALALMERDSGTMFDPRLFEIFRGLIAPNPAASPRFMRTGPERAQPHVSAA